MLAPAGVLQEPVLAQIEEGDVDESYDSYGPDLDEEIEYDDAAMTHPDTAKASITFKITDAEADSLLEGITWFGHASFLIEDEKNIYIDPYDLPEGAPAADIILVSHDHRDHFSRDDIEAIVKPSTVVVSIDAVQSGLPKTVKAFRLVMPGDTIEVEGIPIEAVPAYNIGKKFHPKEKGHVGFVVDVDGRKIYHAGDTDLIPEMKDIDADVILLPIGGTYTMDAKAATMAVKVIEPQVAVPMHWGTIVGEQKDVDAFKAQCTVPVRTLKARRELKEPDKE
jgi:L-ascorbate metabolism protein UlaG (beta-lactamase superfamily)